MKQPEGLSLAEHYPGHDDQPEMESEPRSREAQHHDGAQPLASHFFGNGYSGLQCVV
jgi:hypothetical protein